jgi:hypothetical protein
MRLILLKTLIVLSIGLSFTALAKHEKINIVTVGGCPSAAVPDNPCGGAEDVCFKKGMTHKITWRYAPGDSGKQAFSIVMKDSANHGIFVSGCKQKKKHFTCSLKNSAVAGSYDYSIVVSEDCEHDPRIIINDD